MTSTHADYEKLRIPANRLDGTVQTLWEVIADVLNEDPERIIPEGRAMFFKLLVLMGKGGMIDEQATLRLLADYIELV